jgi:hypothetical protein
MEDDDAAGLKAPGKPAQHVGCVRLKQQHVPTDDSIEGFLEGHLGGFALAKRDVAERSRFGSSPGRRNRGGRSVNANDRAFVTRKIRSQKRDVATTAAYVKDSHPGDDPGVDKELSCDRSYEAGLRAQTLEFAI